jgi:hypothetical protein
MSLEVEETESPPPWSWAFWHGGVLAAVLVVAHFVPGLKGVFLPLARREYTLFLRDQEIELTVDGGLATLAALLGLYVLVALGMGALFRRRAAAPPSGSRPA